MNTQLATPENAFVIKLVSYANPDHGQRGAQSDKKVLAVQSIKDASIACRQYIEEWNLGGGNWKGCRVLDINGKEVARISYNGRAWSKDGSEIKF